MSTELKTVAFDVLRGAELVLRSEAQAAVDAARAEAERMRWKPIEQMPFDDVESAPGHFDKWSSDGWCLLGRHDGFGWVTWVGSMDAGMWLERDSTRACGDCEKPTHYMTIPPIPPGETNGR
jgi:hypothetical protein